MFQDKILEHLSYNQLLVIREIHILYSFSEILDMM